MIPAYRSARLLLAAATLALVGATPPRADTRATLAATTARSPLVDKAVAALRAIATMRADFVQTDRAGRRLTGVMTLKRPGRIRFAYADAPLLIVSDGRSLTMIDYEVNQVQRWPIGNSPLGALLDPARDVGSFGTLQATDDPAVTSIEVRDPRHPEYGIITLIFVRDSASPGGLSLAGWVALDAQNTRTTVRLANQRYGMAITDDTFRWRDPRPMGRRNQ